MTSISVGPRGHVSTTRSKADTAIKTEDTAVAVDDTAAVGTYL